MWSMCQRGLAGWATKKAIWRDLKDRQIKEMKRNQNAAGRRNGQIRMSFAKIAVLKFNHIYLIYSKGLEAKNSCA